MMDLICVLSTSGTTFICTLHFHFAAVITIITHDLLPSGLVAQSVEPRSSVGRATNDQIREAVVSILAELGDCFLCLGRSLIS